MLLTHVCFELVCGHDEFTRRLFRILSYGRAPLLQCVVAEVPIDVIDLRQIERTPAQLQVSRGENADIEWLPAVHEDPLSEVELGLPGHLTTHQAEGPLDVLLNDLLHWMPRVLDDL